MMSHGQRLLIMFSLIVYCGQSNAQTAATTKKKTLNTVIYNYAAWDITEPKQYVLIPSPVAVPEGDLKIRTRALLSKLRVTKRATYGNVKPAFKADYATTGDVYLYLDKDAAKQKYYPIVIAETVYTLTENGAKRVFFPEIKDDGLTRADIPNSSYVLAVPLWRALPPVQLTNALVRLPTGQTLEASKAIDALKAGNSDVSKAVWSYIAEGGAPAIAVIKASTLMKLDGRSTKLLSGLESADTLVRKETLNALKEFDTPAVNKAVQVVMDDDPEDELKAIAAGILSASKNPEYSASAQFFALQSKESKIVIQAVKSLIKSKATETTKRLIKALSHEDGSVRNTIIAALIERKDTNAMVKALTEDTLSKSIKNEIANELKGLRDKNASESALIFLAVEMDGPQAVAAAQALASFKTKTARLGLGRALKNGQPAVRRAAAESLATQGREDALSALVAADLDDVDTGPDMLQAIRVILGKQSLKFVMTRVQAKNETLRRSAVAALGRLLRTPAGKAAKSRIIKTLKGLKTDKDPMIRAAVARSFGDIGSAKVKPDIMSMTGDSAVEVKRAMAAALSGFPGAKTNTLLLKLVGEKDPVIVANASDSLGILKVKEGLNPVINQLNHSDVRVRRSATRAVVALGATLDERNPLLRLFAERLQDNDIDVRLLALEGFKLIKDGRAIAAMAPLVQDKAETIRIATLKVMGASMHEAAVSSITPALDDDSDAVRIVAAQSLGQLKKKSAIDALKARLPKESNENVKAAIKKALSAIKA